MESSLPIQKWYERNKELMDFLAEQSIQSNNPLSISELSRVFVAKNTTTLSLNSMKFKIGRLRPRIPKLESFDKETKAKMMFVLSGEIDENYLNELRKDATVEIDEQRRITHYKSLTGTLEFEGDQSRAAKIRLGKEAIRKRGEETPSKGMMSEMLGHLVNLCGVTNENGVIKEEPPNEEEEEEEREENVIEGEIEEGKDIACSSESIKRKLTPEREDSAPPKKRVYEERAPRNVFFGDSLEDIIEETQLPASYSSIFKAAGQSNSNTTSVQEFLMMMRYVVEEMNSSMFSRLYNKINVYIEAFKEKELRIPIKEVLHTLLLTIRIVTKRDFQEDSIETNSTNLRDFLHTIQTASISLNSSELDNFEKHLEIAFGIVPAEQRISLEKVHSGLDFAIEYILP
ncbi:CRE-BATH-28 protein [Caenorhabditis remanei]|uniref:CRE-BATH-28 protein n=1 Tax=Caenorhabditis remanei TaxID=31234 RepID=E3LJR1_CAERE|nr:CRE-BATH-28 protein [Caenorhabditis remanei]